MVGDFSVVHAKMDFLEQDKYAIVNDGKLTEYVLY